MGRPIIASTSSKTKKPLLQAVTVSISNIMGIVTTYKGHIKPFLWGYKYTKEVG